jgi:NTP pyrophosphatase (non-canonical NTP hydrolase)
MVDLLQIQKQILQNKINKWFNTTDISKEFALTYWELAEAFDAYNKKLPNIGEELADVAIYLLWLSEILWIDLESEIIKKIEKNKNRVYKEVNWVKIKVEDL